METFHSGLLDLSGFLGLSDHHASRGRAPFRAFAKEPSHGRVEAGSPCPPQMRNSISHPKIDFECIRSDNPTKLLYSFSPKI